MTNDLIQEGNRNFSVAMIALESGDFAKSERLLRETVSIMGKNHPVSMLAMKTISSIASEQGRFEDALQTSIDLLESQIATFGVNHSETSRTISGILDMCKDLGKPQIAEDIAALVKAASEVEKSQTTQSIQRLRISDTKDDGIGKGKILKYGWMVLPWLFIAGLIAIWKFCLNSPGTG